MLAAIILMAQVNTAPNPCADQLAALCRMSALFCPSAYPSGLVPGTNGVPCWPERQVAAVEQSRPAMPALHAIGSRGGVKSVRVEAAPAPAPSRTANAAAPSHRSFFSALTKALGLSD
jgi:hypothetical protein